ncbi:6330_t:CDS:2 [Acaulospora colombiana]|uniref:6330_t:CDS:1 n=1 Tax=Acaulospora colombiana TaxID=27376 RepID=A0ACA9KQ76_9GLOM|nr:6330_t:CDS:2 [Acaulospora colombiana]
MLLFQNDTFHFLIFVAISSGICLFIGSWFLTIVPPPTTTTFEEGNCINENINNIDKDCDNSRHSNISNHDLSNETTAEQTPLLQKRKNIEHQDLINDEPDIGGWELLHNKDALLLILIMVFIGGAGLMYINNSNQKFNGFKTSTFPSYPYSHALVE